MLPTNPGAYQTGWRRLIAGLVDAMVFQAIFWLDEAVLSPAMPAQLSDLWWFFMRVVAVAYYVVGHAIYGQSVGKWLVRVIVLDIDGNLPGWRRAMLRDVVPLLLLGYDLLSWRVGPAPGLQHNYTWEDQLIGSMLTGWMVIEVFTMLFSRRRRALHDFIAGTAVVRLSSLGEGSLVRRHASEALLRGPLD